MNDLRRTALFQDVRLFGATGDGHTKDTLAVQAAIDACAGSGGGTVLFPQGRYLVGTLFLKSNVRLYLDSGAVILGSTDITDYSTRVVRCGFSKEPHLDQCLLYGGQIQNSGISGPGLIDGQGAAFKGAAEGSGGGQRPMLIRFYDSSNLFLENIALRNAGAWCAHFRECDGVRISGVSIDNRVSWNNDGIDLMSTRNVRISDCDLNCLDDAICFQNISHERAVENVVISNCILNSRWAAIRSGGAHKGGIRNVTVSNCVIRHAYGCGIKMQISGNGTMENMLFSNIVMNAVSCPISLRFSNAHYHNDTRDESVPWGRMCNIRFRDIIAHVVDETTLRKAVQFPGLYPGEERQCGSICGIPQHPVEEVSLCNIDFSFPGGGTSKDAANLNPPELEDQYPEYFMFGVLPAYALFARHVAGLHVRDARFRLRASDARPAMVFDDTSGTELRGINADASQAENPLVALNCSNFSQSDMRLNG